MQETYGAAYAPGTRVNRHSQAKAYLSAMLTLGVDPFYPAPLDLMMYAQLLKNSGKTSGTIKNYISGAKTFLVERENSGLVFNHYKFITFMKGIERQTKGQVKQAVPIPAGVIRRVCAYLMTMSPEGVVIAVCYFVTLLCSDSAIFSIHQMLTIM